MNDEFVNVTVAVPVQRVPDFYTMLGAWLQGEEPSPVTKGWRNGTVWTANDSAAATTLFGSVSWTARRILSFWASRSGEWVTADDTATAVNVNGPRGVAGSLSSVGKAADKMSRALPFEHETGDGLAPGRYRMSPLVAELFRNAAEEAGR